VRRAAVVLLAWGLWLGALTGVQAAFAPKPIQFWIPCVASAACVTAGLVVWALDARQAPGERPRAQLIADGSIATVALILGLATALLGAGFGLWLILIGAGIAAFGLGGVVREQRARSRTLRGGRSA
jgi:hypothetical protein